MKPSRIAKGFSLVELMIAMVAGLVVIGAVVVFTIATAQSSSTNIRSTRVLQNLRGSLDLIEREIRRSGFDEKALSYAGLCQKTSGTCPVSQYTQLVIVSASCIVVNYDSATNTTPGTPVAGQYHGFRLIQNAAGVGVIQTALSTAAAPNCTAAITSTDWQDVSDPTIVDIKTLSFTQPTTVGGCVQQTTTGQWIAVQDVLVQISGQWIDPATKLVTSRSLEESVRVKNDLVSNTKPSVCS